MPFTFVDLFAGIGGFHKGCTKYGGRCVAACEIDEYARDVYRANYGITPHDDIHTLAAIPNVDLVCAGFPCQSHSTLGRRQGMRDRRGKLFYELVRFLRESKPRAFLLENVKGLLTGRKFASMKNELQDLGYNVSWCVLNSADFGVPQHRERVYIVGCLAKAFDVAPLERRAIAMSAFPKHLHTVLDPRTRDDPSLDCDIFDDVPLLDPPKRTTTGFLLRAQLNNYTNRKLFSSNGFIGTIATGSPPPIYDEAQQRVRHLSIDELKLCQGFPKSFRFHGSPSRSTVLHYIGNAVTVNVIREIVYEMIQQGVIKNALV